MVRFLGTGIPAVLIFLPRAGPENPLYLCIARVRAEQHTTMAALAGL